MDVVQSLRVWKTDRVVRCKPGLLLDLNNAADEIEALQSTIRALSKGDIVPISDKDARIERMTAAINRALPLLVVSNCPSEAEDLLKSALADEQSERPE